MKAKEMLKMTGKEINEKVDELRTKNDKSKSCKQKIRKIKLKNIKEDNS